MENDNEYLIVTRLCRCLRRRPPSPDVVGGRIPFRPGAFLVADQFGHGPSSLYPTFLEQQASISVLGEGRVQSLCRVRIAHLVSANSG